MSFQCQHNNSDNVSLLGTHQSDGFNEHILNPRHFEVEIMNKREREERERERERWKNHSRLEKSEKSEDVASSDIDQMMHAALITSMTSIFASSIAIFE